MNKTRAPLAGAGPLVTLAALRCQPAASGRRRAVIVAPNAELALANRRQRRDRKRAPIRIDGQPGRRKVGRRPLMIAVSPPGPDAAAHNRVGGSLACMAAAPKHDRVARYADLVAAYDTAGAPMRGSRRC